MPFAPLRLLVLWAGIDSVASQIYGARCSYYNQEGEKIEDPISNTTVDPSEVGSGDLVPGAALNAKRLCIPNQCPSPVRGLGGNDLYRFESDNYPETVTYWKPGTPPLAPCVHPCMSDLNTPLQLVSCLLLRCHAAYDASQRIGESLAFSPHR